MRYQRHSSTSNIDDIHPLFTRQITWAFHQPKWKSTKKIKIKCADNQCTPVQLHSWHRWMLFLVMLARSPTCPRFTCSSSSTQGVKSWTMTILLSGDRPFSFSIPTLTRVSMLALPVIRPGGRGTLLPRPAPPPPRIVPSFSTVKVWAPAGMTTNKHIAHSSQHCRKMMYAEKQKLKFHNNWQENNRPDEICHVRACNRYSMPKTFDTRVHTRTYGQTRIFEPSPDTRLTFFLLPTTYTNRAQKSHFPYRPKCLAATVTYMYLSYIFRDEKKKKPPLAILKNPWDDLPTRARETRASILTRWTYRGITASCTHRKAGGGAGTGRNTRNSEGFFF